MKKLSCIFAAAIALCLCGKLAAQTVELPDPDPIDQSVWNNIKAPVAGWGSTDVRYSRSLPANFEAKVKLSAWKGERVCAQAVFSTPVDIKELKMTVSDFKCGKNEIPAACVKKYFVGYVMTDAYNAQQEQHLVADRLEDVEAFSVPERTTRPLWLDIKVPASTPKGLYKATLTLEYDGARKVLPIQLEVLPCTLPEPSEWAFHLDLWQNPFAVARQYNVPLWSKEHFEVMRPTMELYAALGGKVITASIMQHPWNCQTFDPFESMIGKFRQIDGSWKFDYSIFDKWIEFMMSCGISEQIDCYTIVPWTYRFEYYDCAKNSTVYVDCKPGEDAYREINLPLLKDFAAHLKAKGWFEKTCIAMDERPMEQMNAAYALVLEADPKYRIAGAANYSVASGEADIFMDMSVAYSYDLMTPETLERRHNAGQKLTFYTCCSPDRPNTFTFSDPAESAFLGWHSAAVGYDGYLRWAFNSWPSNPCQDSRFGHWAAGDTFIVYPGTPSIRYERMLEGIQDYEKINILRRSLSKTQMAEFEELLTKEFSPNLFDPALSAAQRIALGKKMLDKMSRRLNNSK